MYYNSIIIKIMSAINIRNMQTMSEVQNGARKIIFCQKKMAFLFKNPFSTTVLYPFWMWTLFLLCEIFTLFLSYSCFALPLTFIMYISFLFLTIVILFSILILIYCELCRCSQNSSHKIRHLFTSSLENFLL